MAIQWAFEINGNYWSTDLFSYDGNAYAAKVIPDSFKGIKMQWDLGGYLMKPIKGDFEIVAGSITVADVEGYFCTIRKLRDGVQEIAWKVKVKRAIEYEGKIRCSYVDLLQDFLEGDWPNTKHPKEIWPSKDKEPEDLNNYCVPIIFGTAYIPIMSVNTGSDRYYVLGDDTTPTYTINEVTSPHKWPNTSTWGSGSYSFNKSTNSGYQLAQFIIDDSNEDGTADANGLWKPFGEFVPPLVEFSRSDTSSLTGPEQWIENILEGFGIASADIDTGTGSSFETAGTNYSNLGISWNGGFWKKEDREKLLARLLRLCDSTLIVTNKIELHQFDATSQETLDKSDIKNLSFKPSALTQSTTDGVKVEWPKTDSPQDKFPGKATAPIYNGGTSSDPARETIQYAYSSDSEDAQKAGILHAQKKYDQKRRISFDTVGSKLSSISRPAQVITINDNLFGSSFSPIIESINYKADDTVSISGVTLNHLEDWGDLTPGAVTITDDDSSPQELPTENSPLIGIKINTISFDSVSNGRCYIHGFNEHGEATDIRGTISYQGDTLTIPKKEDGKSWTIETSQEYNGYIVFDTDRDGADFIVNSGGHSIIFAKKVYNTWYYDNGSSWTKFTPQTSHIVIGTLSRSSSTVDSASVWDAGQELGSIQSASPVLIGIKINKVSFDTATNGYAYIHGFNADGEAKDIDGRIIYDGTMVTVPRTEDSTNWTIYASQEFDGYIVFDTTKSGKFTIGLTSHSVIFAKKESDQWYYDDGSAWATFTPDVTDVVIGTLSMGSSAINGANIWSSGRELGSILSYDVGGISDSLDIRGWQFNTTFSSSDINTVAWTSGRLRFSDGSSYIITSGNTGNMTARTYIYFSKDDSETELQVTTNAADAIGTNKVLIAVANEDPNSPQNEAWFIAFNGSGGVKIDGSEIIASSITANEIAANSMTINEIDASTITLSDFSSSDVAGYEVGTLTNRPTAGTANRFYLATDGGNNSNPVLFKDNGVSWEKVSAMDLDDVDEGSTYGRIKQTDISSGHIVLSETTGDLDDVDDGTTWGKVNLTDIDAGHIVVVGSNASINIKTSTFGNDGIQLQYNSGNPRAYMGNGLNKYFKYDGINLSWKAQNTELDTSGNLTASSVIISGQLTTGGGSSIDGQYLDNLSVTAASIANTTITAEKIGNGEITATQINSGTITATEIENATITGTKIASGTIEAGNISDSTITGGKIASSTVDTGNLVNQAITAGKIENLTITASQIADLTITGGSSGKIATNTISEDNIVANTVTAASIAANTITVNEMAANSITANEITANSITASEIASGVITTTEINFASQILDSSTVTDDSGTNKPNLSTIYDDSGTLTISSGKIKISAVDGFEVDTSGGFVVSADEGIKVTDSGSLRFYIDSTQNFLIEPYYDDKGLRIVPKNFTDDPSLLVGTSSDMFDYISFWSDNGFNFFTSGNTNINGSAIYLWGPTTIESSGTNEITRTTTGDILTVYYDAGSTKYIQFRVDDSEIVLGDSVTVYGDIIPSSNANYNLGESTAAYNDAYINNIYFNSDALDDYEEGTYNPSCTNLTLNTSYNTLSYIKTGNLCTVQGFIKVSSGSSGNVEIGLPFTSGSLSEASGQSVGSCALYNVDLPSGTLYAQTVVEETSNSATIRIIQDDTSWFNLDGSAFASGDEIIINLTYRTE